MRMIIKKLIGVFSTVECSQHFKMGKDTLSKYLNSNISRVKLD